MIKFKEFCEGLINTDAKKKSYMKRYYNKYPDGRGRDRGLEKEYEMSAKGDKEKSDEK